MGNGLLGSRVNHTERIGYEGLHCTGQEMRGSREGITRSRRIPSSGGPGGAAGEGRLSPRFTRMCQPERAHALAFGGRKGTPPVRENFKEPHLS